MAAVVTYNWPPGNGTVPPTIAQAALVNIQTVQISLLDGDTTGTITHNWACPTAVNQGDGLITPMVSVNQTNAATAQGAVSVTLANSLTVTVTKLTAAGTGGTWTVVLSR